MNYCCGVFAQHWGSDVVGVDGLVAVVRGTGPVLAVAAAGGGISAMMMAGLRTRELIEFLQERLEQDEQVARSLLRGRSHVELGSPRVPLSDGAGRSFRGAAVARARSCQAAGLPGDHIARHQTGLVGRAFMPPVPDHPQRTSGTASAAEELRRAARTLHDMIPSGPAETLLNLAAEVCERDVADSHARDMAAAAHELARQINAKAGEQVSPVLTTRRSGTPADRS